MHAQEKGVLGDFPNQMSQVNEMSGLNGTSKLNGTSPEGDAVKPGMNIPIAICGMAVRLPGGIASPQQLWDFLLAKGDARGRVPESRYNILAYHSNSGRPGTIKTEYGYFLADSVKLGSLDTSRFSFTRGELEAADPQHRQMLEVVRECFDDAGEVGFRGRTIGCYMGSYGEDWLEIQNKDPQRPGLHRVDGYGDFMQSNRVSYELDLRGPSMTIRTACSSSLVCLHESCQAIQRGDCEAAIVGGSNIILAPGLTALMTEKSLLSPEGSCKTFSADADGFARGEGITAVYIKPLAAAIRDGNPIRAVIRSTASNSDGKTTGILQPSTDSQEAMIRKAYQVAGITDYSKTAFVECHGTGTAIGDPIEANAVARVFGDSGVFIGSVKPNLGHSEGASGLTSLIKAVLTLENRIIPPNIKFSSPNPKIPFQERKLTVPLEPTPWPESYYERVSVNSFGIGGSNAHAILDSAHFSGVSTLQSASQTNGSPQLLLFSASSAASLQRMTIDFQDWVSNNPDNLENLAYTLANRRELLPYRAFMVASRDRPGVASQGKGAANPSPNLVMVFTGQGAQWPRMGRELLLRSDLCFQSSIRSLDNYLQDAADAPTWTLEEELMKPARTSSVQKAELSQPLCTAVQIALVDLFAAVGVKPSVVVGHSSGEIAAAYAAGALTAREAIIAAWQRGRAANKQTRPGAMAAVGLSWDEVRAFLTPNVVVACENSPRSITLSGDSSEVEGTILRIRKSYPDATVKLLKVDKAYHSHHMVEIGDEYRSELQHSLDGTLPLRPFFSSITGKKEAGILDAAYWQKNLESPVLFRAAVSGILDQFKDVAFLEIGPHSALAGPVRQILAAASSSAPYIPAMARNEDCVESFLSAVGKLFELNISLDFNALVPRGSSLPDLPRYPWNHQDEYWPESRISHEWRHREFPSHPLLGLRQLESTSIEPSWRNLLYVDGVSWLRDHRVEDDIIFPCAGYISMVGEGIRQITSRQSSFTVRQLVLTSALVLSEGKPAELVTTFRPHRLTDTIDSKWWEFTIASHNGHIWAKHCSGKVTCEAGLAGEPVQAQDTALLPRKLGRRNYYDMCNRVGFRYGPNFQRLEGIRTGTVQQLATAQIAGYRTGDEQDYHIHPTILDGCIQLAPLAATYGRLENNHDRRVPTKVDRVTIHRCTSGIDMRVSATATITKGNGDVIGQVQCTANGKVVLDVEGVKLSPLEVTEATETDTLHTTARITWGPHIDFLDPGSLIKPAIPRHLYTPSLDELARLCLVYSHRRLKGASTTLPHMQMYQSWIQRQVHDFGDDSPIAALDDAVIMDKINGLVLGMSDTPVADIAFATQKFVNNIQGVFTGEKDALEMLLSDDLLRKVYISTDACDRSQFIRHVAHSKPNLRILEIGAGTGATTASVLKHLVLPIGQPLYSKYTFTDISSAFSVSAKERFKHYRNIEYRVLDISSDPAEQGFQDEKYDLIIATNVIHATKSLCDSLKHVHKLLDHKGRLLLQELYSISKWPNFIFGTLPGWWFGGPDGRPDEPYVAPIRWDSELKKAGFEGLDTVILDGEEPYQWNAIMVAKPQAQSMKVMKKSVTLLYESGEGYAELLSQQLRSKGYTVHPCQLGDELPGSQDVISLLDCSRPFFEDIDEARYKAFQRLLDNLGGSAMLWVTHLCQVKCEDPRYAQMIGTARAIRAEMLLDFATCEVDDISSSLKNIVDVFSKFQEREEDESLEPDYEYVIVDGIVNVGRVYPFSLKDELLAETSLDDQVVLDMIKPGRLGSLRWIPRGARPLKGNEVEIQIYAAGLNFKDVLNALGLVPFPEDGIGFEASGVVCRVGPQVEDLCLGDRVILLNDGSFSTHVITSEDRCGKIPASLTFEDGATIPAVFMTAVYSLFNLGDLKRGQSILIHSACGGVGLAAVQLAKMVGAEIYATVSSEEKVKYLVDTYGLLRNRIFNSREMSFVGGIMHETCGRGVDLALNSLSGELLHATWRCVAEFGKMVEIGKRDLLGAGKLDMDLFLGNRTYFGFNLDGLRDKMPSGSKELLQSVMSYLKMGHITPIRPINVFDASSIQDAFRYMQQGQHIGKIVISMRDIDGNLKIDTAIAKKAKKLTFDSSASYLLVGGLGGIGRAVSLYLVKHSVRRLVYLTPKAGRDDQDFIQELESMGSHVQLVLGSVTNKDDVNLAIQQAANLKGILQCSMILRDQIFTRMSLDEWSIVAAPKVQGTWNLHNAALSAGIQLDCFLLFSSISGLIGRAGQANYSGANSFLDAFVQYRTNLGLSAAALDIGAVRDVGYLSRDEALMKKMQMASGYGITEREILEAVGAAMSFSKADKTYRNTLESEFVSRNVIVLGLGTDTSLDSPENRIIWRKDRRMAVYHNLSKDTLGHPASNSSGGLQSFLSKARSDANILRADDTAAFLAKEIGKKLFGFLLKPDEDPSTSVPLSQLGMDSLVGVEMRSWWRQAFGFDISVLELLGMGNLEGLGEHAAQGLLKAMES